MAGGKSAPGPKSLVAQAQENIAKHLRPGDWAIDATVGNGHDTCFLARCVGKSGRVIGLDVQEKAVVHTRAVLSDEGLSGRVTIVCTDHAEILDRVPCEWHGATRGIVFNLGYLPSGDKKITTKARTTRIALDACTRTLLAADGILSVVLYSGHEGGMEETEAVRAWMRGLAEEEFLVRTIESEPARDGRAEGRPELMLVTRI